MRCVAPKVKCEELKNIFEDLKDSPLVNEEPKGEGIFEDCHVECSHDLDARQSSKVLASRAEPRRRSSDATRASLSSDSGIEVVESAKMSLAFAVGGKGRFRHGHVRSSGWA